MNILKEALAKAQRMETAMVIPYTSTPAVFLNKKDSGYPWHPYAWGFFGGALEAEEKPIDAAMRECREEWGLNLEAEDYQHIADFPFTDTHPDGRRMRAGIHHAYAVPVSNPKDFLSRIRLTEGAGMAFFEEPEMGQLYMPTHNRLIVARLFNDFKQGKLKMSESNLEGFLPSYLH